MIDINLIRTNKELVKENIKKKFQDEKIKLVDEVYDLDKKVREYKIEGDSLRKKRNDISGEIGSLMREKKVDEANNKKQEVVEINKKLEGIESEEAKLSTLIKEKTQRSL